MSECSVLLLCSDGEDGCGQPFEVSARHARSIRRGQFRQLCRRCGFEARSSVKDEGPTDADRLWVLLRFTDEEIVMLASGMTGRSASLETVRWWRQKLMARQPATAQELAAV